MNYLITGGLGFIGSHFSNYMAEKYPDYKFIILDKLDYCSSLDNIQKYKNIEIIIGNILNRELILYILEKFQINILVHFAAQSHVDNSFFNSISFTENNICGTHNLLECCRIYHEKNPDFKKFIHISTDEVYGETIDDKTYDEKSLLTPTNPYAATKAAAEFLVNSYYHSFKLPIIITRGNNVYGSHQYPEKLIPKFICQLLLNQKVTIHGLGLSMRNFIHIDDTVQAIETVISSGNIGEIYNISSDEHNEFSVLSVAEILIKLIHPNCLDFTNYLSYVENRKFNDLRYRINSNKLKLLNWYPKKTNFIENLKNIIEFYKKNLDKYKNIL